MEAREQRSDNNNRIDLRSEPLMPDSNLTQEDEKTLVEPHKNISTTLKALSRRIEALQMRLRLKREERALGDKAPKELE